MALVARRDDVGVIRLQERCATGANNYASILVSRNWQDDRCCCGFHLAHPARDLPPTTTATPTTATTITP